jgi:hypothetical protein
MLDYKIFIIKRQRYLLTGKIIYSGKLIAFGEEQYLISVLCPQLKGKSDLGKNKMRD